MTQQQAVEEILGQMVLGSVTLPAALYRAFSMGRNEGWLDGERFKAAERAARATRPSKAKPRSRRTARGTKEKTRD